MHTLIATAAPFVGIALVAVLIVAARRLLDRPFARTDADHGGHSHAPPRLNWYQTRLLPVLIGTAICLLLVWLLAYVGWISIYFLDRPFAMGGLPPWFGNPRTFVYAVMAGIATAFWGGVASTMFLFVTYCVGDYTLWFEACDGKSEGASVRKEDEE
jgi:hypothetical protein